MSKPLRINVAKAIRHKLQGKSYQEIADNQKTSKSAIFSSIAPILKQLADPSIVDQYRKDQAQIMDGLAARTVASITDEDFTKATLQQKVTSVGILTDKSRLIQGQAAPTVSILFNIIRSAAAGKPGETIEVESAEIVSISSDS